MVSSNTSLLDIVNRWRSEGIQLFITREGEDNHIFVHLIEVPVRIRRRGYGTEVLNELTDLAEATGAVLKLQPDTSRGTPEEVLHAFYKQAGLRPEVGGSGLWVYNPITIEHP